MFASDAFEGRETGQPGQKKAVAYLRQQYMDMGLESPLAPGDYFQEVPLEAQKPPEVSLMLNGQSYEHYKNFVSVGGSESTTFSTNEIVYAGYGIDDDNYSDYSTIDVKGKVVLIKAGEPKNADGRYAVSGTQESSKWHSGTQARAEKRKVAKGHGAKALFMMDNDVFDRLASYYSRVAKSSGSGSISLKGDEEELIVIMVNATLAKLLYDKINSDDVPKVLNTDLRVDLKGNTKTLESENVVALIKGSEKPDEILVISAHLDHLGKDGDKIYNGADDDGSGTIAVVEIAEAFETAVKEGYRPKRSILFLHVTGEEEGLLGSEFYTDIDPIFPLEDTVADLNIDMIGRVDPKHATNSNYVYLIGSDKLSSELHHISEEANAKYTHLNIDYTYNDANDPNRYYYRSDHYNFAKNNVPVIFYFNGAHADYHRPSDTPDKIEYDLYETRARLVFYTAWELANRDDRIIVDKAPAN